MSYSIGVVIKGQRGMPSFGHSLSDEQVSAVVTYIRTHFDNHFAKPVTVSDVAAAR